MSTQIRVLFDIPVILAIECLSKWLSLKDVSHLDSACCNGREAENIAPPSQVAEPAPVGDGKPDDVSASLQSASTEIPLRRPLPVRSQDESPAQTGVESRVTLLELLSSPFFVVLETILMTREAITQWLYKRSIRLTSIKFDCRCDGCDRIIVSKYLELLGMHVRIVLFNYDDSLITDIPLTLVAIFCRQLTSVTFQSFRNENNLIENILLNNPDLEVLEFNGVDLEGECLQGIVLPNLKYLQIGNGIELTEGLCEALRESLAPQIERMDLHFTEYEDDLPFYWCAFGNLRALQLMNCPWLNDEYLESIALNCPLLIHLYLCACDTITDDGICDIAEHLTQLRSLDIRDCRFLTDRSLQCLSQYRAAQLTTLYIDIDAYSYEAITDLLVHSHNLHEFGSHCSAGDSFKRKKWKSIFRSVPGICKLNFEVEDERKLGSIPPHILAQCTKLRELHIQCNFTEAFLLSMLADCPQLQILGLRKPYMLEGPPVKNMYPDLQVVTAQRELLDIRSLPTA